MTLATFLTPSLKSPGFASLRKHQQRVVVKSIDEHARLVLITQLGVGGSRDVHINEKDVSAAAAPAGLQRMAVLDKNAASDPLTYEPKVVPKDDAVRTMLSDIMDTNILFR